MDYPAVYESSETQILYHPHIEAKYPLDYTWYLITAQKPCPFGNNFQYVIVATLTSPKVNAYGTFNEFNAYNLVKYYKPLSLKDAQIIFPEANLTEENYGFEMLWVPEEINDL